MFLLVQWCLFMVQIESLHSQAQQLYCPGQVVELSCTDTTAVVWEGSALSRQCPSENDMITIISFNSVVGDNATCGRFLSNVTDLSPGIIQGTFVLTASLTFVANVSLNGTTVQCEDVDPNNPLEIDQLLDIPATTTPSLMLSQDSQSTVGVMFVLDDTRCVSNYIVNVTQENGPTTSVTATSSPVMVDNINSCQYNYSFVGYTTSVTGEMSGVSKPVDLMVNLTVLDDIVVTLNNMDPLIEWTHNTSLYPSCITGYRIASNVLNFTVNSTVRSLTGQQLNTAGFPYCTTLHLTVTPLTPDHLPDLSPVMGSNNVYVPLIDPDFPTPILSYMFTLVQSSPMNGSNRTNSSMADDNTNMTKPARLRIGIQDHTDGNVETTNYSHAFNGNVSSPTLFNGSFFDIDLPGAKGGDVVSVTVMFENGTCMSSMSANYTVPHRVITNVTKGPRMINSQAVTVTLPLTIYQPEDLVIISTVNPSTIEPIMADFTRPARQYTVMFTRLNTNTTYTFTIAIVLCSNNSADIVLHATGLFTTLPLPPTPPPTTRQPTTTVFSPTTDPPTTPPPMIVSSSGQQESTTLYMYTVTLTLPTTLTRYSPSELIIISTLTPNDTTPITDDYPPSSTQYSVTFPALRVGVAYSYHIRIVLRGNNSVDVFTPYQGAFTLSTPFSTEAAVTISVVVTFVLTVVLCVFIGVLSVLVVNKWRRSERINVQTAETEMRAIYEEPEEFKPDPQTQGNMAYGEIRY